MDPKIRDLARGLVARATQERHFAPNPNWKHLTQEGTLSDELALKAASDPKLFAEIQREFLEASGQLPFDVEEQT